MKGTGYTLEVLKMSNEWKESTGGIVTCYAMFTKDEATTGGGTLKDRRNLAQDVKPSKGEKPYCINLH